MGRSIAPAGRIGTIASATLLGAAAVFAVAALTGPTPSLADSDDDGFDNQDLRGAYGMLGTARLGGLHAVDALLVIFDGDGVCSIPPLKLYVEGAPPLLVTGTCSYQVATNGTGTFTFSAPGFGTLEYSIVLVDGGKELYLAGASADVVATGHLKKQ